MNDSLFISVVTPSYNRADELDYLLQSLSLQTIDHSTFESIISDDGSTDSTEALVNSWKEKASFKIKYITQDNKGPGSARNYGLEESTGDLILFIDSDCEANENWLKIIYDSYNN